ncbi:MAG: hypothetical protein K8U57_01375 [Planctomycetes bacterium]|nr:hypothetical protein [Planctomycetota bacterium]
MKNRSIPVPEPRVEKPPGRNLQLAWATAFAINLLLPSFFGLMFLGSVSAIVGACIAIVIMYFLGHFVCEIRPRLGITLVIGAEHIGVAQLFPILQVVAGLVGLSLGSALGLLKNLKVMDNAHLPNAVTLAGGLLLTLFVGGVLALMALAAGRIDRCSRPQDYL